MMTRSTFSQFFAAWWGATFRPAAWFAQRYEREGEQGRGSWWGPLLFACLVVSPTLAVGILADALMLDASAEGALGRAGTAAVLSPVAIFVGIVATAITAHVALWAMGANRGGFRRTVGCVGYTAGAEVFSILPLVGPVIAGAWRLVVLVRALQVAHRIPAYRALIVVFAGPIWLVVIGLGFRLSLVETYKIPVGSMIPTLLPGDRVLVRRGPYEPSRGDVMVFRFPEDPAQYYVKRVIGREGDEVRMVGDRPYINGWPVPRCRVGAFEPGQQTGDWPERGTIFVEYLEDKAYLVFIDRVIAHELGDGDCRTDRDCRQGQVCQDALCVDQQGPYRVAPNELWVLGDNRLNSYDSRSWFGGKGGGVPTSLVVGPTLMVVVNATNNLQLNFERSGLLVGGTPRITGPFAESLEARLRWCLEHGPSAEQAAP